MGFTNKTELLVEGKCPGEESLKKTQKRMTDKGIVESSTLPRKGDRKRFRAEKD